MIIWINGSINSGKSTAARILAKKINHTALLEIDSIPQMISWMDIDKAVPINLKVGIKIIEVFVNHNLNVIVPYPLSEKNYQYISSKLKNLNIPTYFFTLSPKLEVVTKSRGRRKLDSWEIKRIKHHYKIGIPNPSFGEIIDNSYLTAKETANLILKKIKTNIR